ncbi:MAG: hypothetical protein C4558_08370 [Dehalococcoidia bacterium]|nr:MAG: hypothetical protein C4558_08370 [Dehalococcoidia bacterium]
MARDARPASAPASGPDRDADSHIQFVYTALLFAVLGGFALAVWLPVRAALGQMDVSWLAAAQIHGHLQVMGFAGLFVLGVATRLAPRFGGGQLACPKLVEGAFWCLLVGLLARAAGQPSAARAPFAALMVGGAVFELAGVVLYVTSAGLTLRPSIIGGAPNALLMFSGMVWLIVQATLGVVWLSQLALVGSSVLRSDRDGLLVSIQFFGFLLSVFAGVGLRSFPSFFGMPQPSVRMGQAVFASLQGGLLLWAGGSLLVIEGIEAQRAVVVGQTLVGVAILLLVSTFGWWRRETRFAVASQPLAWPLRATLAMLTLTGLLLCGSGIEAFARGGAISSARLDAVRHIFALGVITQGIVAMAQLILPEFASERFVRPPRRWRGVALASALVGAVVLRGFVPLAGVSGDARLWSMAAGGVLGLAAIAAFGVLFLRARRTHRAYLRRVAVWRTQALPTTGGSLPMRGEGPSGPR